MGPLNLNPLCKFFIRQTLPVTRCRRRNFSGLAQKVEHTTRPRQEHIPIQHESPSHQTSDPYVLVASELAYIRKNMLTMLDTAHPGLAEIADYYFLHPSKQLRSLLALLFARATNGLGTCWERKHWDAACETSSGLSEVLDRPLTLSGALNEWNPSMPDHTASFETVFHVQRPTPRPPQPTPPFPSTNSSINSSLISTTLLPTQIRLAQIVEMVHIASLLHDNTSNPSNTQSPPNPFGNKISILGGDFLLGRACTALARLGESEVVELVASVISNLVEGEILRMDHVRTPELGLVGGPRTIQAAWDLYLRKTYLKTSSLMAKGARSAVILGGCKEGDIWKEVAYAYGRNLGIAYQLMEDVREIENLQPGLASAPVLFASEECPQLLPLLQRYCTEPGDIELSIEYVRGTSGIERSKLLAEAYAAKARDVLHLLPDSDEKTALKNLTEIIVK
ncbi:terpenoid synthase [Phlegmacium glaucopus]|nr:terpenoid synthase [Phlegmacium glaucopus]